MKPSLRGLGVLFLLLLCVGLLAACGKKGPPLPPLSRVPAPPANPQAARFGDDVYVWFTVPSANVSGQSPADVSAIELYGVTSVVPPSGPDLTEVAEKIGTYPVYVPVTPPSAEADGAPVPAFPTPAGFAQGVAAVVRETLTPEARVATILPPRAAPTRPPAPDDVEPLAGPLVGPAAGTLRRHYFLVAVGPRGRASAPTAVLSVPVGDASEPPTGLRLEYTETGMTLAWEPPSNARVATAAADDPALLPAKPLLPPPSPTGYHVIEVPRTAAAPDPYALTLPTTVNTQPLTTTTFSIPGAVRYGEERCFEVRPVDILSGTITVGRASAPACVTPVDTFPPAAPKQLAAIAGVGVINLIWEPNSEADLAGYIVLRGTAPGGTLQALTTTPIRETTYRDQTATPGVLYVYAVVAVDNASPQNVSAQSNRVEDSSRTP